LLGSSTGKFNLEQSKDKTLKTQTIKPNRTKLTLVKLLFGCLKTPPILTKKRSFLSLSHGLAGAQNYLMLQAHRSKLTVSASSITFERKKSQLT